MKYSYRNIIGEFTVNDKGEIVTGKPEKDIPEELVPKVLESLKSKEYHQAFFKENLKITKKGIKESVGDDTLMIQSVRVIDDLNHVINILGRRVREWYEFYNPEYSQHCQSHEKLAELIISRDRDELLSEIGEDQTMGADIGQQDLDAIKAAAERVVSLAKLRDHEKDYIKAKMEKACPNMLAISGVMIGANLIEHAGTIRRLSEMPASTIQLLGAEKALFKHLTTGAKCPKYGLIYNHPFVQSARIKGKAARLLADKISIAIKVDYFKGEYMGDKLLQMLEEKKGKVR